MVVPPALMAAMPVGASTTMRLGDSERSEYDCQRVLAEVAELQKKSLRIEQQYCTRLRKIVGACKLVKAINAERAFGRKAFKKMTK